MVLDPEFHQSVWKPWEDHVGHNVDDNEAAGSGASSRTGLRLSMIIAAAVVVAVGLAAALVVLPRSLPPTHRFQTLVNDIATQPQTAWSSEGGEPCFDPPNQDEAILSDDSRVWSLDLETGKTLWSVDLGTVGRVTCLPGADRVAVALTDPDDTSIPTTVLLDASTGTEVAEFSADSVRQVLPLGPFIGLLDPTNTLRAVDPRAVETTLWSRQLQVPPGDTGEMFVLDLDDGIVQLIHYGNSGSEGSSQGFSHHLRTADGNSPAWSSDSSSGDTFSTRLGDVIAQSTFAAGDSISVLDLQGRELWSVESDLLWVAGSRFYVSTPSGDDIATGYTNLHEVDPRTGIPVNDDVYEGWFDNTVAARGHIAVMRGGSLHILDEHLQEQPSASIEDFRNIFEGRKWVYVETDPGRTSDARIRLSAVDPGGGVLWSFDLEKGQSVGQLGRHLVLVDEDGTFHGLSGTS